MALNPPIERSRTVLPAASDPGAMGTCVSISQNTEEALVGLRGAFFALCDKFLTRTLTRIRANLEPAHIVATNDKKQ